MVDMNNAPMMSEAPLMEDAYAPADIETPESDNVTKGLAQLGAQITGTELDPAQEAALDELYVRQDAQQINQNLLDERALSLIEAGNYVGAMELANTETREVPLETIAVDAVVFDPDNDSSNNTSVIEDTLREEHASKLLIARRMKKYQEESKAQGFFEDIVDVGTMLIPLWDDVTMSNMLGEFSESVMPGSSIKEVADRFRLMNPSDKEAVLDYVEDYAENRAINNSPMFKMQLLDMLSGYTDRDAMIHNVFTALDVVDVVAAPAALAVKGIKAGAKTVATVRAGATRLKQMTPEAVAGDMGNTKMASKIAAKRLVDEEVPVDADDMMGLAKNFTPSVGNAAPSGTPTVNKTKIERDELIKGAAAEEAAEMVNVVRYLDDVEKAKLTDSTVSDMLSGIPSKIIINKRTKAELDISVEPIVKENAFTGNRIATLKIGTGSDGQTGFVNRGVAKTAADRMGISNPEFEKVGEQWFINHSKVIRNEQVDSWIAEGPRGVGTSSGVVGGVTRKVYGNDQLLSERFSEKAHLFADSQEEIVSLIEKHSQPITKLNAKEYDKFSGIVQKGIDGQTWYNEDYLRAKGLGDKEVAAYQAYRNLEDLNWTIDNAAVYSKKSQEGYKTLELSGQYAKEQGIESIDAIPVNPDGLGEVEKLTFFDVTSGEEVRGISKTELNELMNRGGGWNVYRFGTDEGAFIDSPAQHILVPKADVRERALKSRQVEYLEGGRRRYEGSVYIKQGRVGDSGGGPAWVKKSRTLAVTKLEKDGRGFADAMNDAIMAYNRANNGELTKAQATEVIQTRLSGYNDIASYEDIARMVDNKALDARMKDDGTLLMPVEAVRDRGSLSSVQDYVNQNAGNVQYNAEDLIEADSIQRMVKMQGNNRSKRGDHLMDINGKPAPILDPLDSLQKSMSMVERRVSTDMFKSRSIDEWFQAYKSVLKVDNRKNPRGHFEDVEFIDAPNEKQIKLIQEARATKQAIDNLLKTPTKLDEVQEVMSRKMMEAVGGKFDWLDKTIESFKPGDFVKAVATHMYLGMFSPRQVLVQTSAWVNASLMMGAQNAPKATAGAFLMRMALLKPDATTLDVIAKKAKVLGWDVEEFKDTFKALQESQKLNMKTHVNKPAGDAADIGKSTLRTIGRAGLRPYEEVERFNKLLAFVGAHMDFRKQTGLKRAVTDVDRAKLSKLADLYAGNMTSASAASWQRGFASIPTQFLSYQARLFGTIFGTSDLPMGRRVQLAGGMLATWGVGGFIGTEAAYTATDVMDDYVPESARKFMREGLVDTLLAVVLGDEIDLNSAMGPTLRENMIMRVIEGEEAWKLILGAGGAKTFDIGNALLDNGLQAWSALLSPEYDTAESMMIGLSGLVDTAKDQVPNMKRLTQAMIAWNTGNYLDNKNDVVASDLSKLDAFLLALGIRPPEVDRHYIRGKMLRDRGTEVRELAGEYRGIVRDLYEDRITFDEFNKRKRVLALAWSGDPQLEREVVNSAMSTLGKIAKERQSRLKLLRKLGYNRDITSE